jgi:hypothetical protein
MREDGCNNFLRRRLADRTCDPDYSRLSRSKDNPGEEAKIGVDGAF